MTHEAPRTERRPTPEQLERRIVSRIQELPRDLQKSWIERLDCTDDVELANLDASLDEFIQKRQKALIGKAPELFQGMHHLLKDEDSIKQTLDVIHEAEGDPALFVGEGKTAHVYRDPHTKALCYKYVHNFTEYAAWNDIDKEARYMELLEDLEVDAARTPRLTGVIDLPDSKIIAMEYLDAPSLDMYTERGRTLPAEFNVEIFMKKLRAYVKAMHDRGVYHRDLHVGNVLLGENNIPYVIDFGRAVQALGPEDAYEVYDRTGQNRIVLPTDEAWLEGIEIQLKKVFFEQSRAEVAK